jgi:hypothetical protein
VSTSRPWPTVTCTACGATGPGRAGRCARCYARAQHPVRVCAGCGQLRRHLAAGRCARCYRLSRTRQQRCRACGEVRPVYFGDRCERCKQQARRHPGRCGRCGQQARLSGRYCRACLERAAERVGSCADCLCWTGLLGGRCKPCRLLAGSTTPAAAPRAAARCPWAPPAAAGCAWAAAGPPARSRTCEPACSCSLGSAPLARCDRPRCPCRRARHRPPGWASCGCPGTPAGTGAGGWGLPAVSKTASTPSCLPPWSATARRAAGRRTPCGASVTACWPCWPAGPRRRRRRRPTPPRSASSWPTGA